MKRITTYALPPENADKATERNALAKKLEEAIRAVLPEIEALAKAASTDELLEIIHDPAKRTQVHRLIMDSANEFRAKLDTASPEELVTNFSDQVFRQRVKDFEEYVAPLEKMFAVAGQWGEPHHKAVWIQALERIGNLPQPTSRYIELWFKLRRYPALRLLYSGGIAAMAAENYDTLYSLFSGPKIWQREGGAPFYEYVNPLAVFHSHQVGQHLSGMEHSHAPVSNHLHRSLQSALLNSIPDPEHYTRMFDKFEYFFTLVYAGMRLQDDSVQPFWAPVGSYGWGHRDLSEEVYREAKVGGSKWKPLVAGFFGGSFDGYVEVQEAVDGLLSRLPVF